MLYGSECRMNAQKQDEPEVNGNTCCPTTCWGAHVSFKPASLFSRPRKYRFSFWEHVIPCVVYLPVKRDERTVQLTFSILPRCVPGQAEERREENNRSGHSSISEPHLISTKPLLGWVSGTPGAAAVASVPPLSAFRVLRRMWPQAYGGVSQWKKRSS